MEVPLNPYDKELKFNNIYQIKKKISSGSFGIVYSGLNVSSNEEIAIKIEKVENEEMKSVFREIQFLKRLESVNGIPRVYWSGSHGKYDIMVLSLLGKDLSAYLKIYHKFSLKTVILLADQILTILEEIHNLGIIHRDLKPENIVGQDEQHSQVFLIDFGISKVYKDNYGRHIPWREKKSFIGTARYASLAAHEGFEISRKDDLESLGYVLLFLLKGFLPWQNMNVSEKDKCKKVGELKAGLKPEELYKDLPDEFVKYMNYVKGLSFKQNPDYNFLKGLFIKLAMSKKYMIDNIFDWSVVSKVVDVKNKFKKDSIEIKSFENLPVLSSKIPSNQKISSLAFIEKEEKKSRELLKVPNKHLLENSNRSGLNSIGGSMALKFDNTMNNIIDADLSKFLYIKMVIN